MSKNNIYLWERSADDFLQCWPKDSRQAFLQAQPDGSFFTDIKNSKNFYKPAHLPYDPLAARGILNSGIMKFGKLYYQERLGVDFCQVGYVTKGSVFLKSSMGDIRITEGMFFCTPVNSPYILHTDENWEGAWFHLKNNTFLSNRLKRGCLFKKSKYLQQLYFNAGNYLEELQKEHRSYELLDAYAEIIEICIRLDLAGSEDKGFSEFAAKVRGNPAMFACTDDAAKSLGISRYELDKLCMKRIGLSFAKFLLGARMNAARKYLARKCALDHIAKGVGFADAFAFSKAFRAYHKCTPRDFRKVNGYREVQKFL